MLGYGSAEKQNPALFSAFFAPLRLTSHTENLAQIARFLQIALQRTQSRKAEAKRQNHGRALLRHPSSPTEAMEGGQNHLIGGVRNLVGVHFQGGGVAGGAGAGKRIRSRWSCKASKFRE